LDLLDDHLPATAFRRGFQQPLNPNDGRLETFEWRFWVSSWPNVTSLSQEIQLGHHVFPKT